MLKSTSLRRTYRRLRFGKPIVVVSGLPRSGTSMIMKMLEAGGVPVVTDAARAADEDNPLGYFEDERVKNLAGSDKQWFDAARGKAVKVITHLLKELPPQHNYRVILVRRDIGEVLASQAKMLARRGEARGPSDDQMREVLERDLWQARYLLAHGHQFEVMELHYANVLDHPAECARRIVQFVGMPLDTAAMAAVVDRTLYRNRAARVTSDTA
jgi:hypothetical protein